MAEPAAKKPRCGLPDLDAMESQRSAEKQSLSKLNTRMLYSVMPLSARQLISPKKAAAMHRRQCSAVRRSQTQVEFNGLISVIMSNYPARACAKRG